MRAKTKTVTKKTMDDPDLQSLFNQMVGAEDPDPRIIVPKYESILYHAQQIIGVLKKVFVNSPYIPNSILCDFNNAINQIKVFCETSDIELKRLTIEKNKNMLHGTDMTSINSNPSKLIQYIRGLDNGYNSNELSRNYKELKECVTIDKIIVAARDLRKFVEDDKQDHGKEIHDLELNKDEKLSDSFINKYPGEYLSLIPSITILDFKQVWLHESCNKTLRQRIVYALHILLKHSMDIIHLIMSPDIDIAKFSQTLVQSIGQLRKQIPRCDKAFNKIQESVGMLSENFNGYYKDFIVSKNPGIIVENFVFDVAANSKADPELTFQFRKIVGHYKKQIQGKINDPAIQKIMDLVGENLDELERKTGQHYNKKNIKKSNS